VPSEQARSQTRIEGQLARRTVTYLGRLESPAGFQAAGHSMVIFSKNSKDAIAMRNTPFYPMGAWQRKRCFPSKCLSIRLYGAGPPPPSPSSRLPSGAGKPLKRWKALPGSGSPRSSGDVNEMGTEDPPSSHFGAGSEDE
jgi:hypothetical protein